MTQKFDVIIIGVGAMGAATCYQLAKRGVRVLGLEQFDIPHELGSSHGESRMIRMAYYEEPNYVPMLRRAYALWDELEAESGKKILHRTGAIYLGPREGKLIDGAMCASEMHGLGCKILSAEQVRKDWPQFSIDEKWVGVWDPVAGFLKPELAIETFVELARKSGATIRTKEEVIEWSEKGQSVTVRTKRGTYHADRLVITSGPWSGRVLEELKLPLRTTRQVLGWVQPKTAELFELGRFPAWAIDDLKEGIYYGFPIHPGSDGLKVAHHRPGPLINPAMLLRATVKADEKDFRPVLERNLPEGNGKVVKMKVCVYTNTPDGHFVIDRIGERVEFACGFSGHGFKFASGIGEILARRVVGEGDLCDLEFLRKSRF